ncbi:hypothetical protein [Celeribacter neptunius]|uniref:Uncharacterized protein n=1 Tax=Celeribacter neptunius TaxID=588602 RepID=A0A1I3W9L5_9RHOB|nr:hypothetical protein [Celeribacter neptunius]SFK04258.1 hypothetical protein SAMN04487991_3643 [Celeribacter neptunius]
MCISAEALALFLNLILAPVTSEPGRIIVHAEEMDAHWVQLEDRWCTMAPQIQGRGMFAELAKEDA